MSEPKPQKRKKREARIELNEAWCKGCRICVEFCPTQVFVMDGLKAKVENPSACTLCHQCEVLCPDFAINVYEKDSEGSDRAA